MKINWQGSLFLMGQREEELLRIRTQIDKLNQLQAELMGQEGKIQEELELIRNYLQLNGLNGEKTSKVPFVATGTEQEKEKLEPDSSSVVPSKGNTVTISTGISIIRVLSELWENPPTSYREMISKAQEYRIHLTVDYPTTVKNLVKRIMLPKFNSYTFIRLRTTGVDSPTEGENIYLRERLIKLLKQWLDDYNN